MPRHFSATIDKVNILPEYTIRHASKWVGLKMRYHPVAPGIRKESYYAAYANAKTHVSEDKSRIKLEGLVPPALFLFRGGEIPDYGRDISFELVDGSNVLNIRVHVQLKSLGHVNYNKDHTISFPINLNTLAYLQNNLPGVIVDTIP